MKKFGIITNNSTICYNHYLSDGCIKDLRRMDEFKEWYPLGYHSRKFDKPAEKWKNVGLAWCLDNKIHRIGKPAMIWNDGDVEYYKNGEEVR